MMWVLVALGRGLDHLFFPGFKKQPVREPVFIVAPPRTGSTLTQKLMSLDEERFTYNALYQTIFPAVTFQRCFDGFIWLDHKLGRPLQRIVELAEKKWFGGWDDMHKLRFDQPEEDDGFFVYTFVTEAIFLLFLHVEQLWQAGFVDALPHHKRRKVMAFYRSCLQRRLYVSGSDKTILAKATQSSGAVEALLEAFPDAKFITIVRDPSAAVASHVSVFWPVWKKHSPYLKKDGPESKAYALLAVRWFQHLFAFREKVEPRQYYCIDYRDLTQDPQGTLEKLYRHFGWTMSERFRHRLAQVAERERKFESNHSYSLEDFGLSHDWIRQELGEILDYYGLDGAAAGSGELRSLGTRVTSAPTPPGYVHETERDQHKPVSRDNGGDGCSAETLNGDQQSQRDVTIACSERYDLPAGTVRSTESPADHE
jgi:hypothetical protein